MGIQTIEQKPSVPILGKIRLGIRKESKSGSQYPSSVPYFVLTDAPGVEEVYGKDPVEIDIMFPGDDLEKIIPTWLRWFSGGVKGSDGSVIGGKLNCIGNGPDLEGRPGTAKYFKGRNLQTGEVPVRPCAGDACPDWRDSRGIQQCKAGMQVFCILPRVSWLGVYQIDTSSWHSIRNFHDQLKWMQNLPGGRIALYPFKIVREETVTNYFDPKENKEKSGKQHIMYLRPNETFLLAHGKAMGEKIAALQPTIQKFLPAPEQAESLSMEDNYPVLDAGEADAQTVAMQNIDTAQQLVNDPEIAAEFEKMEAARGSKLTDKDRLILIRKKENEPGFGKAYVITTIRSATGAILAKAKATAQPAEAPPPPPAAQKAPPPPMDDGGGIM